MGVFFRFRYCGARGPREGEAGPCLSTSRLCHLIFRPKSQLEVRRQSSTRPSPLRKNRSAYIHRGTTQKRFAPCQPLLLIQLYALPLAGFRCVKYRAIRWHVPLHVEQSGASAIVRPRHRFRAGYSRTTQTRNAIKRRQHQHRRGRQPRGQVQQCFTKNLKNSPPPHFRCCSPSFSCHLSPRACRVRRQCSEQIGRAATNRVLPENKNIQGFYYSFIVQAGN